MLVVDCHILAAAMKVLCMESLDDEPCAELLPLDVWMHDIAERREMLCAIASVIIDSFVDLTTTSRKNLQHSKTLCTCMHVKY